MLFRKRRDAPAGDGANTESLLAACTAREQASRGLGDNLLAWLGQFAVDEAELDVASFHSALERLRTQLRQLEESGQSLHSLREEAAFIPQFIARQQHYLRELDGELRMIVNILTKAVVEMNSRNSAYNSTMLEQIETMTALGRLEDIRKLKSGLALEIDQLRETLRRKQEVEASSIHGLAGQVEVLRNELEVAQDESRRDGLTGIYNRRAFDWFVGGLLEAGGSRRSGFALLLLDLDDFKFVNDHYGHPVGDRVLLALVAICRNVIRSEDFFARYGGDEFVLVFPGASARAAARKGRQICEAISSTVFTVEDSSVDSLVLSVSIGVTAHKSGESFADLLKRADSALYKAKREGKNRVGVE
ncbi:MAG: diguanylate cyclase [Haliea sp.]